MPQGKKNKTRKTTPRDAPVKNRGDFLSPDFLHRREIAFEVSGANEAERSVELSFSSQTGVERWDWWEERWYSEILDHSPVAVRLDRLRSMGVGLFNHDMNVVVGRLVDVRLDEVGRVCRCRLVFDEDEESERIFRKVLSGTLRGVSVGYRVFQWEDVRVDHVTSDGFAGPAMVARSWEPYEVSIVSCPADSSVGVGRAFGAQGEKNTDKGCECMSFKEAVAAALREMNAGKIDREQFDARVRELLDGVDPEELPECMRYARELSESLPAPQGPEEGKNEREMAAERARVAEITSVGVRFGVDAAQLDKWIRGGVETGVVYREVLEMQGEKRAPVPSGVRVELEDAEKFQRAVTDGLRMKTGQKVATPAPGAEEFRGISMLDLARLVLERRGERLTYRYDPMEIAGRAFSTSDFPVIMSNLASVTLLSAYNETPTTWRAWCSIGSQNNFKPSHKFRLGELPELEPVLEHGEYKMADMVETQDSFAIGTHGKKFALTRYAIVNDDLGAFTRIPQLFGAASARTINRTVYRLVKKNPKLAETGKALFSEDHKNLGSAAALGIAALDTARVAMRRQAGLRKDSEKVELNITPTYLLIPPELETLANQILYSDTDITSVNPGVKNPFRNALTPIVEPAFEGYEWYLTAAPGMIDTIEVAFLNGNQSPVVEQQQGWNVDGIEYKVRLDFGVFAYEHRGMYKNPGAKPGN